MFAAPETLEKPPSLPEEDFYPTPVQTLRQAEYPNMNEGQGIGMRPIQTKTR